MPGPVDESVLRTNIAGFLGIEGSGRSGVEKSWNNFLVKGSCVSI
jgi:hypothetical protein